jgi:peptidoglycan L-alanyl-D-glutamate endopeptidase CwlK
MTFNLGGISRHNLIGVHPALVQAVEHAISLTRVDFQVFDGVREIAEQRANLARGVSWTMNSRHLRQPDGFGHAADLVPLIDGKLAWDWDGCVAIAFAMARAASAIRLSLRWGGVWDLPLTTFATSEASVRAASQAYVGRRRKAGHRASLDGPHFELLEHLPQMDAQSRPAVSGSLGQSVSKKPA